MRARCYNKNGEKYKNYGGRGIKVCRRWHVFINFYNDVKDGYKKGLTIDRIKVNGDYKPSNYRWATNKVQGRNRTNNRLITCMGETITLSEWVERSGISNTTIRYRLKKGWSIERAIFEKAQKTYYRKK
jgi:hypothetical protein